MRTPLGGRRAMRHNVAGLIDGLGPTPDDIAGSLVDQGVQGVPGNKERCALACFLRAVVGSDPEATEVAVQRRTVVVSTSRWRPSIRVPLPTPAKVFVDAFDARFYPNLVAQDVTDRSATPTNALPS
jgi:hypothetical protein